jgi:hypothetical protein
MSNIVTSDWDDYLQQVYDAWVAGSTVEVRTGPGALHNFAALVDGGSGGGEPEPATPTLTGFTPDTIPVGALSTYTATGSGFTSVSKVQMKNASGLWIALGGVTFVSSTELQGMVGPNTVGPTDMRISNGPGVVSNVVPLNVAGPVLTSLSPTSGVAGTEVVITATGTDFPPGSVLTNDGIPLPSTYVDSTTVTGTLMPEGANAYIAVDPPDDVHSGFRTPYIIFPIAPAAGDAAAT